MQEISSILFKMLLGFSAMIRHRILKDTDNLIIAHITYPKLHLGPGTSTPPATLHHPAPISVNANSILLTAQAF